MCVAAEYGGDGPPVNAPPPQKHRVCLTSSEQFFVTAVVLFFFATQHSMWDLMFLFFLFFLDCTTHPFLLDSGNHLQVPLREPASLVHVL